MRPVYETNGNIEREQKIAAAVAIHFNLTPVKLKALYQMDYLLTDDKGNGVAFCEAKWRGRIYDDIGIGLHKWEAYMSLKYAAHLQLVLAYQFQESEIQVLRFTRYDNPRYTVRMGGRTDRNDDQDIEPHVYIPFNEFRPLSRAPHELTERSLA